MEAIGGDQPDGEGSRAGGEVIALRRHAIPWSAS